MSRDQIEQAQEDFFQRLRADGYFLGGGADVPVLAEHKGATDDDINQALSTLNANATGATGVLAVVLMPTLTPEDPNAPGPRHTIRLTVQVIDQPLLNSIGKSASQVAERVRTVLHRFRDGLGGTWSFAGMEPIPVDEGKVSYGVAFTRLASDNPPPKVAQVLIAPAGAVVPQLVTLTCATAGAAIRYTLDGSYPSPLNPTAVLYSAPFNVVAAATLRTTATLANYQQSDVSQATFT